MPVEELRGLHSSPSIVTMIRLRYVRGLGHSARKENYKIDTGFWWGKLEERNHVEDLGAGRKVILKCS